MEEQMEFCQSFPFSLDERSTRQPTKDEDPIWKFDRTEGWDSDGSVKKRRSRKKGKTDQI
ncbi:hypothetical protein EPI10_028423 [Gossypium australe]|uniref:Uncharacterized protein n=1 Tax=Gossypium australe TaxID=47621 RepID=A0A5B6UXM9_9ROSI|nr:hypothetical protein EPI10_028423 [Gossypium australe]